MLLLDPVNGTKEEQEAFESQAIGRAQYASRCSHLRALLISTRLSPYVCSRQGQQKKLVVVRFVCDNTVEKELYERTVAQPSQGTVKGAEWRRARQRFIAAAKIVRAWRLHKKIAPSAASASSSSSSSSSSASASASS